MSRSAVHFLFSLLLLVSQQIGMAHGFSHWDQARRMPSSLQAGAAHGSGDRQDVPALHEFCAECAADAQLDLLLPVPDYTLRLPAPVHGAHACRCDEGVRPAAPRLFEPRGPPRANRLI